MNESHKLVLEITQEIDEDEFLDTCEILSPKALMGAVVVDVVTNRGCDPEGDYYIISELHIRLSDGRVIIVTFQVDEGMIVEQWMPMDKGKGVFSDEEVKNLNDYQNAGVMHPFTCENGCGVLIATNEGWHCPECGYRQYWAHDFMLSGEWRKSAIGGHKPNGERG